MKTIFLHLSMILSFCFLSTISFAQNPNWAWARSSGGSLGDGISRITCYSGGNIYVTGGFNSPSITIGSYTLNNAGSNNNDIFTAKYDSSGNVLWAKGAGEGYDDYTTGITTDPSGNVYITGTFYSASITFGSITLTNSHTAWAESFIVKFDPSGNVLWAKKTGAYSDEVYSHGISSDKDGNIFICGCFSGNHIAFGSYNLVNSCPYTYDIFIAKYSSYGSVIWARSAGGLDSDFEYFSGIATDGKGNAFIAGNFRSVNALFSGTTIINSDPIGLNADICIAKYGFAGNLLWVKSAGNTDDEEYTYGIATDANDNAYITGSSGNILIFENDTLTSSGFLAKFDPFGNELWAVSGGGYNVAIDDGGHVYIVGSFFGSAIFGNDTLINAGTYGDIFIVKYDTSANVLWAKSAGSINDDVCSDISIDDGGDIYVAGSFSSPSIDFGSNTLVSSGSFDCFVAKLGAIGTSVPFFDPFSQQLMIYPNPATDNIIIFMPEKAVIEILNINGQIVKTIHGHSDKTTVDLKDLSSGIYIIKAKTEKGIVVKKFIKE